MKLILDLKGRKQHWRTLIVFGVLLTIGSVFLSLLYGPIDVSLPHVFNALIGTSTDQFSFVITEIRLPRALLALLLGATLAGCGAMSQGMFRNPLADPSLIGVTAGASLGASFVIVLLQENSHALYSLSLVTIGAFLGSVVVVTLVYRVATSGTGTSVSTMLLAGIGFTFLAGSMSNLFEYLADNEKLRQLSMWRMGGLESADYLKVYIAAAVALIIFLCLPGLTKALNVLLLGESEARHLGINTDKVKFVIISLIALGVGSSVALVGPIAFIGLVVPHVARLIVGPNHQLLLPLAVLLGASLLLLSDVIARTIVAPNELPVGIVTAIVGAPIFIAMLKQRHRYGMQ